VTLTKESANQEFIKIYIYTLISDASGFLTSVMEYEAIFNQPVRILKFFSDEVEEIPASEGEQAGIESNGNAANIVVSVKGLVEI
jgi:hypothetical protein